MRVSTGDGMWMVPPQRALWMPAGVRRSIDMLRRSRHADALPARGRRRVHARGLPGAADLAAAARADRTRDGAALALYDEGGPAEAVWSRLLHRRTARPRSPCLAATACRAIRGCARFSGRCWIRRAISALWANWAAGAQCQRPAPGAALPERETGLSFGAWRRGRARGCWRRWDGCRKRRLR